MDTLNYVQNMDNPNYVQNMDNPNYIQNMDNPNYEEDELGGTTRVLYGATPLYRYMQKKTGDTSSTPYLFFKSVT